MKPQKLLFITSALTLILSLTSCASYSASPLSNLASDVIQTAPENEGITVLSKSFTRNDCDRFLDRDVISEGYQPVQIYIQNGSNKSYIFSLNRVSLPVARPQAVADTVHTSTAGRAAGYGAGALILWPLAIPAIVDGIKSSKANTALDNDFAAKAAKDQVIQAHSQLNAIIFVPVHAYQNNFSLTLIEQGSEQPKTFNVTAY